MFIDLYNLPTYYIFSEEIVLFFYILFWLYCIGELYLFPLRNKNIIIHQEQEPEPEPIKNNDKQNNMVVHYEDKYKEYMSQIKNSKFVMNEKQLIQKELEYEFFYKEIYNSLNKEYDKIKKNIIEIENDINDDDEEYDEEDIKKMIHQKEYYNNLLIEYDNLMKPEEIKKKAEEKAYNKVYDDFLMGFLNNCVMEYTPKGNVLMIYNHKEEAFEYYSDHEIPYQYLEVIARKYVNMFDCGYLYIDMNDHIEKVLEEEKQEKKSVFVKPKKVYKEVLVKNKSNRYVRLGKIYNFPILKIPAKKEISHTMSISYREYIKLYENKS